MKVHFKSLFSLKIGFILLLLMLFLVFHIKTPAGYTNIFFLGQELDRTSLSDLEWFFANPAQEYCWADIDNLTDLELKSDRDGLSDEDGRRGTGTFVYNGRKYFIPDSEVQTEELSELTDILKRNYCSRQIRNSINFGLRLFAFSAVLVFIELLFKKKAKGKCNMPAQVNSNRNFIASGVLFSVVTFVEGVACFIDVEMTVTEWRHILDINQYLNISLCLLGIILAVLLCMKKKGLLLSLVWCLFIVVKVYLGFTDFSATFIGEIIIWIVMAALVIGMQGSSESRFRLFCTRAYSIPVSVFALLIVTNSELPHELVIFRIILLMAVWTMLRALKTEILIQQ